MEKRGKSSSAFDEFILRRCEEIIAGDTRYRELNNLIIEQEQALKKTFQEKQSDLYNKLEVNVEELIEHTLTLVYRMGFNDRINLK